MSTALSTSSHVRLAGLLMLLLASGAAIWAGLRNHPAPKTPLEQLQAGNERFAESRRKELARGDKPVAAVVTLADSHLAPELILDQRPGRLVTLRTNDPDVVSALEDAVKRLHVPLVVVLTEAGPERENGARNLVLGYRRDSASLRDALRQNETALAVAVYHPDTGKVEWSELADADK
jgi:carbonic anhydrase